MDVNVLSDAQCASGRRRRVGLAPQWQVLSLQIGDVGPNGRDAPRCASDGDTKAGLTGASTQEPVNTIAQGMSV
jgi:hypothetical protein